MTLAVPVRLGRVREEPIAEEEDGGNEEEEGEMERKREVGEMKTDLLRLIGREISCSWNDGNNEFT